MARNKAGRTDSPVGTLGRSGLQETPGDSGNGEIDSNGSLRQDGSGEETKSRLKYVTNNYNRTSGQNTEVERNNGREGIVDQSSNRGNTLDERNGRPTSQSSTRIDNSLPLFRLT